MNDRHALKLMTMVIVFVALIILIYQPFESDVDLKLKYPSWINGDVQTAQAYPVPTVQPTADVNPPVTVYYPYPYPHYVTYPHRYHIPPENVYPVWFQNILDILEEFLKGE
jgi:hypothetical protein